MGGGGLREAGEEASSVGSDVSLSGSEPSERQRNRGEDGSASAARMPPFLPVEWDAVLRQSKAEGKFIVVYLHSAMHDDSAHSVRMCFATPQLSDICARRSREAGFHAGGQM